ncbi:MAG: S49 family peptidase [Planctomycetota bacterium]
MSTAPILPSRGLPSGYLAAEPRRLAEILRAARSAGPLPLGSQRERSSLWVTSDGVAIVSIDGVMSKDGGWFGASTRVARAQVRDAGSRNDVRAIALRISSPGGYVDGTADLAADVAEAATRKPVHAFIEDICASAAYWVACQATKVWCNATGLVGSIGAYQVLVDESGLCRELGIVVHLVATGPLKGAGEPGTEITPEILEYERKLVGDLNAHFLRTVRTGRGLTPKQLETVTSGAVWIASEAKGLGLIDGIRTLDDVVADLAEVPDVASRGRALRARVRFELEAGAIEPPAAPTPLRDRAARAIDDARGATS